MTATLQNETKTHDGLKAALTKVSTKSFDSGSSVKPKTRIPRTRGIFTPTPAQSNHPVPVNSRPQESRAARAQKGLHLSRALPCPTLPSVSEEGARAPPGAGTRRHPQAPAAPLSRRPGRTGRPPQRWRERGQRRR